MGHRLATALVLASLAAWAAPAAGQVESRCPTGNLPKAIFPGWVEAMPIMESQQTAPPLAPPDDKAAPGVKQVSYVTQMDEKPRGVVEAVHAGRFKEAAEAGEGLLRLPNGVYDDYTWDYLGSATAWAYLQQNDVKGAVRSHYAAATRVGDGALALYHRLVANTIAPMEGSAEQAKDAARVQAEVSRNVQDRVASFKRIVAQARKGGTLPARIRYIETAYAELHVLQVTDPPAAESLKGEFIEAADVLSNTVIPSLLEDARGARQKLVDGWADFLPERQWGEWNRAVVTLWNRIQHVKRVCRMHNYLVKLGLASNGDQTDRMFREAHELFFVPGQAQLVWQPLGHTGIFNGIEQKDIRRRVPWQETPIAPWGQASPNGLSSAGWKMMGNMTGDGFNKMSGDGYNKMDGGGFNKMDGNGFNKMGGNGFNNMNGGGWNKMDGGGWNKP
jgi:hypothetical protein